MAAMAERMQRRTTTTTTMADRDADDAVQDNATDGRAHWAIMESAMTARPSLLNATAMRGMVVASRAEAPAEAPPADKDKPVAASV